MNTNSQTTGSPLPGRVTSVDFFRGFTMFLLAGEASHLYARLLKIDSGFFQFLGTQLEHHEWHGLHFWDLIQPFFMFIVGVAIPFAVANRLRKGDTMRKINLHAYKRAFLLLFFGWALYFIEADHLVFRLQNVLAQLSVTYLVAFLIRNKSFKFQIIFTLVILLLIDLAYRFFPVQGFNHPWVPYENLGSWLNNKIEGVDKASIWATLNFVSTTAHTVWGVLCGKLLMSEKSPEGKDQDPVNCRRVCPGHRICSRSSEYNSDHQENCNFIIRICQRRMDYSCPLFLLLADRRKEEILESCMVLHHCRNEQHLHIHILSYRKR